MRRDAADALRAARGGGEGFDAFAAPESRREAVAAWRKWLEAQPDAPWEHPLPLGRRLLGRTLVSLFAEGRLVELDEDGKRTFEVSGLQRPWAVQGLPNGHRLVVLLGQQALIEYDATGAETARLRVPGQLQGFQRLENGNTLVAIPEQECVFELRPDGGIASQLAVRGTPLDARLLDNGHYLVCLARPAQVVEVERGGAVVWSVAADLRFPVSAQRLENGNTLVAAGRWSSTPRATSSGR